MAAVPLPSMTGEEECTNAAGAGSIARWQEEGEEQRREADSHSLFTPLSLQKLLFLRTVVGVNNVKAISLSFFPLCLIVGYN